MRPSGPTQCRPTVAFSTKSASSRWLRRSSCSARRRSSDWPTWLPTAARARSTSSSRGRAGGVVPEGGAAQHAGVAVDGPQAAGVPAEALAGDAQHARGGLGQFVGGQQAGHGVLEPGAALGLLLAGPVQLLGLALQLAG